MLKEVRRRLKERTEQNQTPSEIGELETEARRLRNEIDRLVQALASGTESPSIAKAIGEREQQLSEVKARLQVMKAAPSVLDLEVRRMEKEARSRLADLQELLGRNPTEARKALEALFSGPLRFRQVECDDGPRYEIEAAAIVGTMFTTDGVPNGI
ncbi:MAG TPA: hypothetical protein VGJ84_12835 [Polyangiaceae bacterium]